MQGGTLWPGLVALGSLELMKVWGRCFSSLISMEAFGIFRLFLFTLRLLP